MDPLIGQILLQILLIGLNAVFACAEISIISLDELMLKKRVNEGDKKAQTLMKLLGHPTKFLATIQVGITLSGALGSAYAADNFGSRLTSWLISLGISADHKSVINTVSVLLITLIISYFTLVFGELVPKRLAMKNPVKISNALAGLIDGLAIVSTPIVNFLNFSTNIVLKILGVDPEDVAEEVTEEQIRALVEAGRESGTINPEERMMIENIFEFDDRTVNEIMVHRIDMNVLWIEDDLTIWEDTYMHTNNSILPVCDENIDDIKGTLSLKSFYNAQKQGVKTIAEMLEHTKKPYFVPEYITIDVLFENMQRSKNRFVFVLDEYGGLSGIATINDVLEEIVGEFDDAEDKEPDITLLSENKWRVQGTISLNDLSNATNTKFPDGDYDTLGGLIVSETKTIPTNAKEVAPIIKEHYKITVESVRLRRVEYAIFEKIDPDETKEDENSSDKI